MGRTRYAGPDREDRYRFGDVEVALVRPADPDRMLDEPSAVEWNNRDDYMPYWAYLWPGATMLAEGVAARVWPEGTRALEIGCGLGMAGLVAAAKGCRVLFTDYDETPLEYVRRSVRANGFPEDRCRIGMLDWRELPPERYPLVLGADVLYERKLVPLVLNLIATMLEPGGIALVAGPERAATVEELPGGLERHGLVAEAIPMSLEAGMGITRGTLHRIWRRGEAPALG